MFACVCVYVCVQCTEKKDFVFEMEKAILISLFISELPIFPKKKFWRKYILKYQKGTPNNLKDTANEQIEGRSIFIFVVRSN